MSYRKEPLTIPEQIEDLTAQVRALQSGRAEAAGLAGQPNGAATLGPDGKLLPDQLPESAQLDTLVWAALAMVP